VIATVQKILDKAWQDNSDDSRSCKRWIIVWAMLAIIAGVFALWYNILVGIAEVIFIPALLAEIWQRGIINGNRVRLVQQSGDMLKGATNQLLIQEKLRREKLSERLEG